MSTRREIRAVRRDLERWSAKRGINTEAVLCGLDAAVMSSNPHPVILAALTEDAAALAVRAAR